MLKLTSNDLFVVGNFMEAIELTDFTDFVRRMHQYRNKGFDRAFQSLPGEGLESCSVAKKNKIRNRFHNIHPCKSHEHHVIILYCINR